ncbi:restriction endonuclease subunit S [Vibrio owensii]|uniref:restriction endonuclease subunit S n=1 Tax=Vibrio owensii TaxID=696485 RepID=UPI004067EF86
MGKYQAYPEYKDSGVEWLDEIPSHWRCTRLKRYCKVTDGSHHSPKIEADGYPFISVTDVGVNSINFSDAKRISLKDYGRLVREGCKPSIGDVLLTKDGTIGRACIVKEDMPDFVILSSLGLLTPKEDLINSYLYYYLVSGVNVDQMNSMIHGSALRRMTISKIDDLILVLPSYDEQTKIASFLDHETAKIDTLIDKQQRLIKLLKEKRQAVISYAVTKGLNPDAPMKDSGIEWLGEVPDHWNVSRLKFEFEVVDCRNKTPEYFENGEYFVVRTTNVKKQKLNFNGALYTDKKNFDIWTQRGVPPSGSILFTREAPTGEVCLVPDNLKFCMGQRMMNFISNSQAYTNYLFDYLISDCLDRYINSVSHGSTVSHLRVEQVENIPVPVPPENELIAIHEHISKLKKQYDAIESNALKAIDLMKERRTALISSAVTGKIDVRNWQAPVNQEVLQQEAS